jgi:hypothetical protein
MKCMGIQSTIPPKISLSEDLTQRAAHSTAHSTGQRDRRQQRSIGSIGSSDRTI